MKAFLFANVAPLICNVLLPEQETGKAGWRRYVFGSNMMPIIVKCDYCGKDKKKSPSQVHKMNFCNMDCWNKYRIGDKNPNWKGGLMEKICPICGEIYRIKKCHDHYRRTCSMVCSGIWESLTRKGQGRKRVIKFCVICGEVIEVKQSHIDTEGTYCSKWCMAEDYRERLAQENNPHWKGGMVTISCKQCGNGIEVIPAHVEKRQFCSTACSAIWRIKNGMLNHGKRSKSGKRDDLDGLYVRSSWEANYARYLKWLQSIGEIQKWEFEPEEFEFPLKRGTRFYLPDFKITNNDGSIEYHEIKGWMDKKSATKLKRMAKYHPDVKLILVDKDAYYAIAKQVKNFIPYWESQKRT